MGDASIGEFTFILRGFKSRVGDVVAIPMDVPNDDYSGINEVVAWGRITTINRYNPFFPYEAAQELASEEIPLVDTVLSKSRDQLQATVLVLGFTSRNLDGSMDLYPLTYPIPPAADVKYPSAAAIGKLLAGGLVNQTPLNIGTLIARSDVKVDISADRVVARHIAIMAMTGGGKTVAARRIIRELIEVGYPLVILDPHGDYLGLWEKRKLFPKSSVKLFYPRIVMTADNRAIVETLVAKMTQGLTEPQKDLMSWILTTINPRVGQPVQDYIRTLVTVAGNIAGGRQQAGTQTSAATANAVRRSLELVLDRLTVMEISNTRLRATLKEYQFDALTDPEGSPESVVRPGQVSILYLGGYDHLTQSTIVSILLEALFKHRAELANRIPPFFTVVEEAHNFVPSTVEGTEETPSLVTLRKIITEGRKFGAGLLLITQRPSRVEQTILAQCNSFLVMRLVNPKDQSYVQQVMENLPASDAKLLPGFGPGQGIIGGQAVRFPLLVKIKFDQDLVGSRTGDENFIKQARDWKPDASAGSRARAAAAAQTLARRTARPRRRG